MTAISAVTAVLAALVVHIQLLIGVIVILIRATAVVEDVHAIILSFPRFIALSVFIRSAHMLNSFRCVVLKIRLSP